MLDATRLTDQGLKDGLVEFARIGGFLALRTKDAEARLAAAEQDVTELRKLVGLVRGLADGYRARLKAIEAEKALPRPDG